MYTLRVQANPTQARTVYCNYLYAGFGEADSPGEVFTYKGIRVVRLLKDLFERRQLTAVERRSTSTWLCLRCRRCRRRCCRLRACRSHPGNVFDVWNTDSNSTTWLCADLIGGATE